MLDLDVQDVFRRVGHDGSGIIHQQQPVRRGFHVQEMIDVAWQFGCTVTRIDVMPQSDGQPPWPIEFPEGNWPRFWWYVQRTQGVLLCRTMSGRGHAVVSDMGLIYDPKPGQQSLYYTDLEKVGLYPFSLLIVGQRNEFQRSIQS